MSRLRPESIKRIASLSLWMGFLVAGCDRAPTRVEWTEDILWELALWAFANADTDLSPPAAYCVGVLDGLTDGPRDPSTAFLNRFDPSRVPVVALSECTREQDFKRSSRHALIYEKTGRHALGIFLGPVELIGDRKAMGHILVVQGGLWGAGHRCTVEEAWGELKVESCERTLDI